MERMAPTNSWVLLGGESGVGKDMIARAIHQNSRRASGLAVVLDLELTRQGCFREPPSLSSAE